MGKAVLTAVLLTAFGFERTGAVSAARRGHLALPARSRDNSLLAWSGAEVIRPLLTACGDIC